MLSAHPDVHPGLRPVTPQRCNNPHSLQFLQYKSSRRSGSFAAPAKAPTRSVRSFSLGTAASACGQPLAVLARCKVAPTPTSYTDVAQLLGERQRHSRRCKSDTYLAKNSRDPQMRFCCGIALSNDGKTEDAVARRFASRTEGLSEPPEPYNNLAA